MCCVYAVFAASGGGSDGVIATGMSESRAVDRLSVDAATPGITGDLSPCHEWHDGSITSQHAATDAATNGATTMNNTVSYEIISAKPNGVQS